jgi:hypothetical protein
MKKVTDLSGKKFGRLLVQKRAGSQGGNATWECLCDCGNITIVKSNNLIAGTSRSCGCLEKELRIARMTTHGLTKTRLHKIWESMKHRCYYEKHEAYKNYGGKGVVVCDEWKDDFQAFYDWATANGYEEGLTIDRIDPAKGYSPSNCQWLTRSENTKKAWDDRRKKLCEATEKS